MPINGYGCILIKQEASKTWSTGHSLSICLYSEHKNLVDFCVFTMWSLTMLNSLIHSSGFTIPLHFLYTQSCHLQIMTFLVLPFQSLNLFSCLVGLTRTSRRTLHEIRYNSAFTLFLTLRKQPSLSHYYVCKIFIIPLLCMQAFHFTNQIRKFPIP